MIIAYTVWTWHLDPFNSFKRSDSQEKLKIEFEKGAREISFLGYTGVENFNIIIDTYGDCVDEFKAVINKYNLTFTAIYHYLKTDFEADMAMGRKCIKFLRETDCEILNLQAPKRNPAGHTQADVLETARKADILGKLAYENHIKLCLHPHWNSAVETEEDIELFVQNTNPDYVKLCIDTAHTHLAGMDQIKTIEKYKDRIAYIHFKDVHPDVTITPERPMNRFTALGQGAVDFKGIYKKLKEIEYNSVICVELDYPKVCNFQSAQASRSYIQNILGV
jgi:inosose dehydratase